MPDVLGNLLKWLKPTPRYLVAMCLATGILLFLPPQYTPDGLRLQTKALNEQYGTWIVAAFLVSTALTLTAFTANAYAWLKPKITEHSGLRRGRQRLRKLTPPEKSILALYVAQNTRTQYLTMTDGVAAGLEHQHIIYRATHLSQSAYLAFAYNLQPWAWDYLTAHPDLLEPELSQARRRPAGCTVVGQ
jgi:hypothetical protein